LQNAQFLGAKLPANIRISPRNGLDMTCVLQTSLGSQTAWTFASRSPDTAETCLIRSAPLERGANRNDEHLKASQRYVAQEVSSVGQPLLRRFSKNQRKLLDFPVDGLFGDFREGESATSAIRSVNRKFGADVWAKQFGCGVFQTKTRIYSRKVGLILCR
jgi:hypothetical protein